jgi:hypothetical protein
VGDLELVHRAQLLVVTNQDNLLGIHHGREDLNLTGLCGFIDDDFLEGDVLKSSGLRRLAGGHNDRDVRQDQALHFRLDFHELSEIFLT